MAEDKDARDDDAYELDLDESEDDTTAMNELFEDALEAVDKGGKKSAAEADPELVTERRDREATVEIVEATSDVSGEAAELRDRLIRTMADFDNFRKRTEREKADQRRQGASRVLKDFLEVVDNLERALSASAKIEDLRQGVEMILRQQIDILRRHGVEKVESVGQPFDPNLHEAVAREEGEVDLDGPTVKTEMQAGYRQGDRLLRPAMVTVAVPPTAPTPPDADAETEIDHDDEHTVIGFDA